MVFSSFSQEIVKNENSEAKIYIYLSKRRVVKKDSLGEFPEKSEGRVVMKIKVNSSGKVFSPHLSWEKTTAIDTALYRIAGEHAQKILFNEVNSQKPQEGFIIYDFKYLNKRPMVVVAARKPDYRFITSFYHQFDAEESPSHVAKEFIDAKVYYDSKTKRDTTIVFIGNTLETKCVLIKTKRSPFVYSAGFSDDYNKALQNAKAKLGKKSFEIVQKIEF